MNRRPTHAYEFGPFRLLLEEHLLLRDGAPVQLTPKAFETLVALLQKSGHLVEKGELMRRVWPDAFVDEGGLARNISVLRKALGESAGGPQYIETVPKLGYRFVAEVREVRDDAAQGKLAGASSVREEGPGGQRDRTINSLAVLPLVNESADGQMEYLSDGITESIINSLAQLPQLRVMARSTVFRYKGREGDARGVGRELEVGAVLVGRVSQLGDHLVVSAELVDVAGGWHLWGEQYSRQPADIFAVQAEIAREIAGKLRLRLSGEEQKRLGKRYTEDTEAYQCYLKGRYHWNKRPPEGLKEGMEYFRQAIRLDPNYALAYAGLADSYTLLGTIEYAVPPRDVMAQARAAATKALEIDDTLAEAHTSLGIIRLFHDWDFTGAASEFKRAIELNPNYATAHNGYAVYLTVMGQHEEAAAELQRALDIDPLSPIINMSLGYHGYYLARQYDRSIEQYKFMLELDPNFYATHALLGMAYMQKGMYAETIAEFQKALDLSGGSPLRFAALGHAYGVAGKRDEARRVLSQVQSLSEREYFPSYFIALIHMGLGERDEALDWLEKAYEERAGYLIFLADPVFDSLRSDPRFADLVRRVGLQP